MALVGVASGVEQVHVRPDLDEYGVRAVVADVPCDVVCPRLEPVCAVDEQVRVERVALDLGTGLPAVAVLTHRNERLGGRNVTGHLRREVAEHEERRLRGRPVGVAVGRERDVAETAGKRPERERARGRLYHPSSGVLRHINKNIVLINNLCDSTLFYY